MASAFSQSLYYLTGRNRTVHETGEYLRRKNYSSEEILHALTRLLELDLLDDRKTAAEWVAYTMRCKPRGRERLNRELRARGINKSIVEEALAPVDEEAELELALQLLSSRPVAEWTQAKLFRFLRYRGFSFSTLERVRARYEYLTEDY